MNASPIPDLSRTVPIETPNLGRHGASCGSACGCGLGQKPLSSASSLLRYELLKPSSIHCSQEEAGMGVPLSKLAWWKRVTQATFKSRNEETPQSLM